METLGADAPAEAVNLRHTRCTSSVALVKTRTGIFRGTCGLGGQIIETEGYCEYERTFVLKVA